MEKKKNKKEIEKERDHYLEGWKRAKADLINFRAQEESRFRESLKRQKKDFVEEMLPVLDNFDLAQEMISKEDRENQSIKGLLKIKSQLDKFLKDQGIEKIKTQGEYFDPNIHEALEMVEGKESGKIAQEIQKGYLIDGEVLRPARVKVIK